MKNSLSRLSTGSRQTGSLSARKPTQSIQNIRKRRALRMAKQGQARPPLLTKSFIDRQLKLRGPLAKPKLGWTLKGKDSVIMFAPFGKDQFVECYSYDSAVGAQYGMETGEPTFLTQQEMQKRGQLYQRVIMARPKKAR